MIHDGSKQKFTQIPLSEWDDMVKDIKIEIVEPVQESNLLTSVAQSLNYYFLFDIYVKKQ